MFKHDFIKLRAAVHELSCSQSFDDAENFTAVASADSIYYNYQVILDK